MREAMGEGGCRAQTRMTLDQKKPLAVWKNESMRMEEKDSLMRSRSRDLG